MPKLNLIDILKNTILEQAPIGMSSDYGEDSKFYTTDTKGKVIPLVQPEVQKDTDVVDNSEFPGIPGEWVKLAKLIASKESSSYTSLYPSTTLDKKGLVNATSKTFKEVQDFLTQKGISNNAVGRWQFKNLLDKVKGAGLSETDLFNPTNQNKLFMYLVNNKRSVTIDSLKKDLYGSAKRLAMEWSSLPVLQDTTGNSGSVKRGDSYYSGKASINADEFESVLKDISNSTEEKVSSELISGDLSSLSTYKRKGEALKNDKYFILHHTGGRGTAEGVMSTLNNRGLSVQFIIDRQGKIFRGLPEGTRASHIKNSVSHPDVNNNTTQGVEIIGSNDNDILLNQCLSAYRLVKSLGYSSDSIYGHGEVNPHKHATEGQKCKKFILDNWNNPMDVVIRNSKS